MDNRPVFDDLNQLLLSNEHRNPSISCLDQFGTAQEKCALQYGIQAGMKVGHRFYTSIKHVAWSGMMAAWVAVQWIYVSFAVDLFSILLYILFLICGQVILYWLEILCCFDNSMFKMFSPSSLWWNTRSVLVNGHLSQHPWLCVCDGHSIACMSLLHALWKIGLWEMQITWYPSSQRP